MSENRAVIEQELRRVLGLELGAPHTAPVAGQAWQPARSYDAAIGGALARGAVDSWERADPLPTRRTITGDYLVPLLQAVTLGVLVGGGLLLTFGEPILARGAGTLATVGWYLRGIWSTGPGVLWRSETVFGRDINGDGHVGRPEPVPEPQERIRVETIERKGRTHHFLGYTDLPEWFNAERARRLAVIVLANGKPFSRRGLGDVLSQGEYPDLAESFLAARLVFQKGSGYEMTESGRRFLRRFLPEG